MLLVGSGEGTKVDIGGLGVDFKIWGEATGGRLAVVEHPMEPRRLVPPHVHEREDELSYVLEGTFGVRIGDWTGEAGPGTYVYKPRGILHTFWNPTDRPARMIELMFPAGFERYFETLAEIRQQASDPEDLRRRRAELGAHYGLTSDLAWVGELKARFGLRLLGEP